MFRASSAHHQEYLKLVQRPLVNVLSLQVSHHISLLGPPFFPLQNVVCFIILSYLVPVLFTFYLQGVLKLKKYIIPSPKGEILLSKDL